MKIRDLVAPFAQFASEGSGDDLTAHWQKRIVEPHAEIYRAIEPWMGASGAGRRLPELVKNHDELQRRAGRAQEVLRRAHRLLSRVLPDAGRINAVVLVGLGKANGWAVPVNGKPTVFLAVDQLPEPGYDVVLALHEMLHAEHLRRASHDWPGDRVDADLFREGLAVQLTSRLIPEVDASGHLWFAPGHLSWVSRCQQMEMIIRRRLLADLRRTDRSNLWFSGAADRDTDLPGRCGYWLGWRLLDRLMASTPLEVAMHWPLPEVSAKLQHLLQAPQA